MTPNVAPVLEGPVPSLSWVKWVSHQPEETAHSAALPWEGGDEPVMVGPASAPGARAGSKGSHMCPFCLPSPAAGDTSALGKGGLPAPGRCAQASLWLAVWLPSGPDLRSCLSLTCHILPKPKCWNSRCCCEVGCWTQPGLVWAQSSSLCMTLT